ncbi:zf-B_box domain-containing protein/CCT domain-containing protein [Cephalotus follicularis]|uniref:Zf-B_box domain-containing protein/CCT domain-containing protein n=1 Tax=Cephalotus follicularis TaxID=3775 RepID=A0A1Q3CT03_CEPFO|nr:zf-B_box domain-containing protein/CCT domain-containing protein [Cephalotus follicularis]
MADPPMNTNVPLENQQIPQQQEEAKNQTMKTQQQRQRLCDYCNDSTALLYCRADSAKLCLSCDREVHSTNQLFSKHFRSLLCDSCDESPASIFCETEHSVLCQNCDWQRHKLSLSLVHNRRSTEGFNGCPKVRDLLAIVGFEDMDKKDLFLNEDCDNINDSIDALIGFDDGLSDFLIWETPNFASLNDLIVAADSEHNFQAMGVPSLRKNRNVACGQHKEEILRQLRELAKLEPSLNYESLDPVIQFQSLMQEKNLQPGNKYTGCENDVEPISFPSYEGSAFQWFSSCEAENQDLLPSTLFGDCFEENSMAPDKQLDINGSISQSTDGHGEQSQHPIINRSTSDFTQVVRHEPNSQDRDSALSRYKEKKKTRRFDKHIRYESRKARAESRTRIKGRFAKTDH